MQKVCAITAIIYTAGILWQRGAYTKISSPMQKTCVKIVTLTNTMRIRELRQKLLNWIPRRQSLLQNRHRKGAGN